MRLFHKPFHKPRTFDFSKRRRTWGHDFTFSPINGGKSGHIMGWGEGMKKGDYIILQNGEHDSRYQFTKIEYFRNPPDMFSGEVVFSPRPKPVPSVDHDPTLSGGNRNAPS